jgi:hypothetical protein
LSHVRLVGAGLAILLALKMLTPDAIAQGASASLEGEVRLADGGPAGGAVVQVRSDDTGVVRVAVCDDRGAFRFPVLAPGRWTVVARTTEGSLSRSESVDLGLNEKRHVELEIGEGQVETVTVTAEGATVDRMRTSGEIRIGRAETDVLPLDGGDITQLALMDAAVRPMPEGNLYAERAPAFVINGQSGRANSFLVDGLDNNDQTSNTNMNAFFSEQVIQDFVVITSQFAPEYGRASGGVVNVVTRGGSNDFQGRFFVHGSNANWSSEGPLVESLPDVTGDPSTPTRLQAGFSLGGPIKKDKAFWFLAYEHTALDEVVPWIGLNRSGEFGGWTTAAIRGDNLFLRTDFNLGRSNVLTVRLSADDRDTPNLLVGAQYTPEVGFRVEEQDFQVAAALSTVVSPRVINEARLLVGTSSFNQFANSDRPGVDRPSGMYGGNDLQEQLRDEDRIQLVENLTWVSGRHTAKFGFDITRSNTRLRVKFNPNGSFLYTSDDPFEPGDCGNLLFSDTLRLPSGREARDAGIRAGIWGVCDRSESQRGDDDDGDGIIDELGYLNTYPLAYRFIDGAPNVVLPDTRYALFAQDTWNVSPRWLLVYGLRYDLSTFTVPPEARVPSETIPNGGAEADTDNVAPRFGFTYTPFKNDRLVIRGGAGVHYDKLVLAFPAVSSTMTQTTLKLVLPQPLTLEINEQMLEEGLFTVEDLQAVGLFAPELTMWFATGTELNTPYTVQYSLGFEGAATPGGTWKVNATRALGYDLPMMRDLNPVVTMSPPCLDDDGNEIVGNISCLGIPVHRDENFGSIATLVTEGRSWFTGVDVGWLWRGRDVWYSATYTWSKTEDMAPDPLKSGIYLPPDSDDLTTEIGRSDFDRRHRFVLAGALMLPRTGIRLSGQFQYASAVPFNVTTGQDENRDGIDNDRPEGVERNSGKYTDLEAINEIRRTWDLPEISGLSEPSLTQLDLKIAKLFATSRGQSAVEVYLQVFNVLDTYNGADVIGRITSQNFGRAGRLAGPPRTVELGLRYAF